MVIASLSLRLLLMLGGCTPTCEQVCEKLIDCEELSTERMGAAECTESCLIQRDQYADWTDTQLEQDFDDHLSCLQSEECAAIAEGACYDDEVFSF